MAHKALFMPASKSKTADTSNEANGRAYAFSPEHTLAQYAATGTFNQTFYAHEVDQLQKVLDLASKVDPEIVAKTAVYCREKGLMKDMPAFLTAYLAVREVRLLAQVFPRVIDNGKMLRSFVQIIRSGVVGRKSFGSAPKRLARAWFASRAPEVIFRQSLGSEPSLKDVIKMVRPSPKLASGELDAVREALYGYLIGKDVPHDKLPPVVQAFEAFKKEGGDMPDVPFEMLTALVLNADGWTAIARKMSWTQLRMNLNTLHRHGVFGDESMVRFVASKLRDPELVRRARVFPFQLLAAFKAAKSDMPAELTMALQEAMEVSIENVPKVEGKVFLCPDVSGSMQSPATGFRKGGNLRGPLRRRRGARLGGVPAAEHLGRGDPLLGRRREDAASARRAPHCSRGDAGCNSRRRLCIMRQWFKSRTRGRQPRDPGAIPGRRSGRMTRGLHW
jgi:60 kDa SS-A/Ro ribonucleoprotein